MLEDPACPACGQHAWETVGEQVFERRAPGRDAYLELRFRVLFELWASERPSFRARFVLCRACGMVVYSPRATAEEVDAKYRLIAQEADGPAPSRATPSRLDRERSAELFALLNRRLAPGSRILDFGGGVGALMSRFVEAGHRCGVVDYTAAAVAGVQRLGDTLDDLPADARFDLAVCSHVFEHVAEPVRIAEALAARLEPDGLLFVEVPLEIVAGPPKMREPVTHVSFFCVSSMATCLSRAGLEVLDCRIRACLFANGSYCYGVQAVARAPGDEARREAARARPLPGSNEARRLLKSGVVGRSLMLAAHPRMLYNPVRSLRKRWRRLRKAG